MRQHHDAEVTADAPTQISVDHPAQLDAKSMLVVLATLDERLRVPLSLFYFDQLCYREIAEILNVPIGTVMSRLSRGRAVLRQRLEQERGNGARSTNSAEPEGERHG